MRHAYYGIAEAKGVQNFGSGWKQRDDSHGIYRPNPFERARRRHYYSYSRYFARMTLNFARSGDQLEMISHRRNVVDQRIDCRSGAQQCGQLGNVETIRIEAMQGVGGFQGHADRDESVLRSVTSIFSPLQSFAGKRSGAVGVKVVALNRTPGIFLASMFFCSGSA